MASAAADQQWKDRYRDLVRELEDKEREWALLEKALRSAAAKLAHAAMGQSPALDSAVDAVLDTLRTDLTAPRLDASVSSVVRALQLEAMPAQLVAPPSTVAATPMLPAAAGPDITIVLRGLFAALAAHRPLAAAVSRLEIELGQGLAGEAWEPFVRRAAEAVGQVVGTLQTQRQELEAFLQQVTHQLSEFERWTTWQEGESRSRRDDTLGLEHGVQAQVAGLHREIEAAPDLASLKTKVQTRLDAVAQQLLTFRAGEERRQVESEKRTRELHQEVVKLKGKTDELVKLCADQESRLMLDSLTGVHSRYAYERRFEEEFQRWRRHGQPLTFSIWDIDLFKRINDAHGHDAGDRLLRGVADILGRHKRAEDFLARIGGEEFVLLLPMTSLDAAMSVADKLRGAIATTVFRHHGEVVPVTVSCGLTEFRDGDSPTSVYERADRALYNAKERGRNRCEML